MTAREIAMEAKSLLQAMPASTLLTRDTFVQVCVESSICHLREREDGSMDRRRLRTLLERELGRAMHRSGGDSDHDSSTPPISSVSPAKVAAAEVVKGVLDAPYRHGRISRQRYAVIVLAVLERVFPDLSADTNRVMEKSETDPNDTGGVDPPQDPHGPLRGDVVQRLTQLTEQALQYYKDAESGEESGSSAKSSHEGEVVKGVPPLPKIPLGSNAAGGSLFEQQVERLRQVLEEKFALDLTGAHSVHATDDEGALRAERLDSATCVE